MNIRIDVLLSCETGIRVIEYKLFIHVTCSNIGWMRIPRLSMHFTYYTLGKCLAWLDTLVVLKSIFYMHN